MYGVLISCNGKSISPINCLRLQFLELTGLPNRNYTIIMASSVVPATCTCICIHGGNYHRAPPEMRTPPLLDHICPPREREREREMSLIRILCMLRSATITQRIV